MQQALLPLTRQAKAKKEETKMVIMAIPVFVIWLGWIGMMGFVGHHLDAKGTPLITHCEQPQPNGVEKCEKVPIMKENDQ